jgi:hypothetical protein
MADQTFWDERSALPKCGVENWNAFRRDHPKPKYVVLNFASLADAQLANIDLHRAFRVGSDLQRTNLTSASLERAILRKANCHESDLRRAILDGADLSTARGPTRLRSAKLLATIEHNCREGWRARELDSLRSCLITKGNRLPRCSAAWERR